MNSTVVHVKIYMKGNSRCLLSDFLSSARRISLGFPREKRENEEFADEEFLTRKTDEENEEFFSLKMAFFYSFWRLKYWIFKAF